MPKIFVQNSTMANEAILNSIILISISEINAS